MEFLMATEISQKNLTQFSKTKWYKNKEYIAAFCFLLPNLLGFILFMLLPVVGSFLISFFDWRLLTPPQFVGLKNFIRLFSDDLFWKTVINTFYFVVLKVPIIIFLSLFFAILLNKQIVGKNIFRTICFLPMVCSAVSIALIFKPLMGSGSDSFFNHILSHIGLGPFSWINSSEMAMESIVFVAVWKEIGYFMVIFLAGLQGISRSYYEAAKIDGANFLQVFRNITLPLISPTTFFIVITSVISSFQIFDLTSVLTRGGPGNATNTIVMYIYQSGFEFFRMGYSSALSYVLFTIIFIFTFFQNKVSKKWVHY